MQSENTQKCLSKFKKSASKYGISYIKKNVIISKLLSATELQKKGV